MANFTIKNKISSVKNAIPQPEYLIRGELVINDYPDNEAIFFKNQNGKIVKFFMYKGVKGNEVVEIADTDIQRDIIMNNIISKFA